MASVTNRYTEALLDVAKQEGSVDAVAEDCRVLEIALRERELKLFLANPSVGADQKAALLDKVLRTGGREAHARTTRFLAVVLERGRQDVLLDIVQAFRARALELRGKIEGVVETATELSAEDLDELARGLGKRLGKELVLTVKVDETLLGGFRARVGDSMFDASLKSQLEELGHKLKGIPLAQMQRGLDG